MHNKRKYNGHNVHKGHTIFPMDGKMWSATFMYVVCPERSEIIGWYEAANSETGENNGKLGRLTECRLGIRPRMLGSHGYLQEELTKLKKLCRDRLNLNLCNPRVINSELFNDNKGYMARDILYNIASMFDRCPMDAATAIEIFNKEEKKMSEIRKDRLILNENEGCYLEITPISNKIIFHFGGEARVIDIPERYEMEICPNEREGVCDLRIKKKKPKLLNMRFTVKAGSICRRKYRYSYHNDGLLADDLNAVAFPEEYAGDPLRLVIRNGVVSTLSSDGELLDYDVDIWRPERVKYTVDDIPRIESKIRMAYNNRKIFPNATNGIEIIKEDL